MSDSTKLRPLRIGVAGVAVVGFLAAGLSAPAFATPTAADSGANAECPPTTSASHSSHEAETTNGEAPPSEVDAAEEAAYRGWVARQPRARAAVAGVDVTVYFHNFQARPNQRLTYRQVLDQLARMNGAYAGRQGGSSTRFEFVLGSYENISVGSSRINVDSARADRLKRTQHVGTRRALNVYVAETLVDNDGQGLNGTATFPWRVQGEPNLDGIWLDHDVMVGVPGGPANRNGDTLVHETGHWLGLYHVFEGFCNGTGDQVADTGRMSRASFADNSCRARNTCTGDGGRRDPIRNFMSYSGDNCRLGFTAGQAGRMSNQWSRNRA